METLSYSAYRKWIWYPIAAYALSWVVGFFYLMLLVFPVLLTAAQYQVIKQHEAIRDAKVWFVSISAYLLSVPLLPTIIPFLSTIVPFVSDEERATLPAFVAVYYGCQICSEIWMKLIFNHWRYGYFSLGNAIAWLSWSLGYAVMFYLWDHLVKRISPDPDNSAIFWVLLGIPLPSVIANLITGYFLHLALKPMNEE